MSQNWDFRRVYRGLIMVVGVAAYVAAISLRATPADNFRQLTTTSVIMQEENSDANEHR